MKKWEVYSNKFREKAIWADFEPVEIEECLKYAKKLYVKNLPIIYDQRHLSLLVGYNEQYLRKVTNSKKKFYRTFYISKKSGGKRKISEPLPNLKEIQYWILEEILYKCYVSGYAKAYRKKRSIKDNAKFHLSPKILLTIDIKNFFGSINYQKVHNLFISIGYSKSVATMLSNLCTLENVLPQGAPTSPTLSNILMKKADRRIAGFTRKKEIKFTRYADDMNFSGDFEPGMIIKFVREVLTDEGLKINEKKIRVRKPHQRQEVTGVVVNKKLQAPRDVRRKLRQSVYYIKKFGLSSHLDFTNNLKANHIRHLLGIANFIFFINPEDKEVSSYLDTLYKYLDKDEN